jgi:hypothetical protein
METKFSDVILITKPVPYKNCLFVPEIIVKIKNTYFVVSEKIQEIKKWRF